MHAGRKLVSNTLSSLIISHAFTGKLCSRVAQQYTSSKDCKVYYLTYKQVRTILNMFLLYQNCFSVLAACRFSNPSPACDVPASRPSTKSLTKKTNQTMKITQVKHHLSFKSAEQFEHIVVNKSAFEVHKYDMFSISSKKIAGITSLLTT